MQSYRNTAKGIQCTCTYTAPCHVHVYTPGGRQTSYVHASFYAVHTLLASVLCTCNLAQMPIQTARLGNFSWLMETQTTKVVWRFVYTVGGVRCVMTCGTTVMPRSSVTSWNTQKEVCVMYNAWSSRSRTFESNLILLTFP